MKIDELPENVVLPNYKESILNLSCSIQQYYGIKPLHPTLPAADSILAKKYKHVVVVLLDGLGMTILEHHLHARDFLRRHLITDYSSVFPPTTTASTTTMLSGKSPIEHGWLGWDVYFEQEDKTITCFFNTLQGTNKQAADYNIPQKYIPYENIIDQINKTGNAKAYGVFPFGNEPHKEIDDWCQAIEKTCNSNESTFTYAYWENPDGTLHRQGNNSTDVEKVVRDLNATMAGLCARCKDTLFFITADHGHINIQNEFLTENYPEITEMLERKVSLEPRAISFYVKPEYKEKFPAVFNRFFGQEYVLFSKEEVLKNELFGPGFPNSNLTGIGDYVAAAYTSKTLLWSKGEVQFKSHHAGLSSDEMRIPLIWFGSRRRHTGMIIWYIMIAAIIGYIAMALF